ncbi:MAG: 4Fe-4S single cluster domain-containing protein [Candidatus Rifleibacteriota bacterium]
MLRVAGAEAITEVEGPGRRFALWVQGCSRSCPGCCNPHMHDYAGGSLIEERAMAKRIIDADVDGLTIVGGEPLEQIESLNQMFDCLDELEYDKSIMLFTGFAWSEICNDSGIMALLQRCDVVVAGPFMQDQAPDQRRWIGSGNQTVHFFRNRLDFLRENWPKHRVEIEFHISDGQLSINGFPVGDDHEFEKIFAAGRKVGR